MIMGEGKQNVHLRGSRHTKTNVRIFISSRKSDPDAWWNLPKKPEIKGALPGMLRVSALLEDLNDHVSKGPEGPLLTEVSGWTLFMGGAGCCDGWQRLPAIPKCTTSCPLIFEK